MSQLSTSVMGGAQLERLWEKISTHSQRVPTLCPRRGWAVGLASPPTSGQTIILLTLGRVLQTPLYYREFQLD